MWCYAACDQKCYGEEYCGVARKSVTLHILVFLPINFNATGWSLEKIQSNSCIIFRASLDTFWCLPFIRFQEYVYEFMKEGKILPQDIEPRLSLKEYRIVMDPHVHSAECGMMRNCGGLPLLCSVYIHDGILNDIEQFVFYHKLKFICRTSNILWMPL